MFQAVHTYSFTRQGTECRMGETSRGNCRRLSVILIYWSLNDRIKCPSLLHGQVLLQSTDRGVSENCLFAWSLKADDYLTYDVQVIALYTVHI